jgi:hypothetical protein
MPRKPAFSSTESDLGLDVGMTRSDFLDASFGRGGKPAAPEVLRRPAGRVAFANADLHDHQSWADATAEGKRAIEQLFG